MHIGGPDLRQELGELIHLVVGKAKYVLTKADRCEKGWGNLEYFIYSVESKAHCERKWERGLNEGASTSSLGVREITDIGRE